MSDILLRAVAKTGEEIFTKKIRETLVLAVFEGITLSTAKHFMDKLWNKKAETAEEA